MPQHDPTPEATDLSNGDLVMVTPGALAGPGEPHTALGILCDAGWSFKSNELGNARVWSPDHLVCVAFLPEYEPGDDLEMWAITVYRAETYEYAWMATFDDHTPAEMIAAVCRALVETHTKGICRDLSEQSTLLHPPHVS